MCLFILWQYFSNFVDSSAFYPYEAVVSSFYTMNKCIWELQNSKPIYFKCVGDTIPCLVANLCYPKNHITRRHHDIPSKTNRQLKIEKSWDTRLNQIIWMGQLHVYTPNNSSKNVFKLLMPVLTTQKTITNQKEKSRWSFFTN